MHLGGYIVVGYQGIGKSTLGGTDNFIDLESGNFWVDGKRHEDWYKSYCAIAYHLAKQGYKVFTSSHKVVRDELKQYTDVKKYIVFPNIDLKERWIERLEKRYKETELEKDYKALMNAKEMFDENITDLSQEKEFDAVVLQSMDYDLHFSIKMSALKNCPFCGCKAKKRYRMPLSWVECKNKKCRARTEVVCDGYTQGDGMTEAEQMWNNGEVYEVVKENTAF